MQPTMMPGDVVTVICDQRRVKSGEIAVYANGQRLLAHLCRRRRAFRYSYKARFCAYVAQYMEQLRNSKDGGDATILGRTEPGGGTEEDVYLGQSQDLYSADSGDCGISSSAGFYSGSFPPTTLALPNRPKPKEHLWGLDRERTGHGSASSSRFKEPDLSYAL